ncbi:hypothetical protein ALC57_10382 [Trachymyrmex cornetzi]|uniref:Peptidase A2 domain-containing protein n=1 Tax=Trachymyrmex cornetzi TaxID=471704 RepID=A0A151J471_9HYME|nr:hypothetical protein ALC57_10382 [Trachymyrmex cornetzi]
MSNLAQIEPIKQKIRTASTVAVTALHKFIFEKGDRKNRKKSLAEPAKMLINSKGVIKSWKKLKEILRDEFIDEINCAQRHDMLVKRRLKRDETLQEHYYAMKEIAARGKIEAEALIKYVIDGIPEDAQGKIILYGAKRLTDFKEKLKVYEYKKKELGKKCFKCKKFWHTANLCNASDDNKAVADKKTTLINTVTDSSNSRMFKRIAVNGARVSALIDTGSQITVIRKDVYDKMKLNKSQGNSICLTGFGKNEVHSLGKYNNRSRL